MEEHRVFYEERLYVSSGIRQQLFPKTREEPEIIADGGTINMASVNLGKYSSTNVGNFTLDSKNGGVVKLGGTYFSSGTQTITCDGGAVYFTGDTKFDQNKSIRPKITLKGDGALLSFAKAVTLGRSSDGLLQINLTPTLSWGSSYSDAHIKETGKVTFKMDKMIQYYIDVTAFTNYYGTKKMALAAVVRSDANGTFTYNEPTLDIVLQGEGRENCSGVTIKKGTSSTKGSNYNKCAYLSITSTNVPEGKVAAINNSSKFFDALPAAVAAAADGETVMVFDDMAVAGSLIAAEGCAVTVDAPKPVVIKLTGKIGEGVTFGANVTVKKTGMTMYLR